MHVLNLIYNVLANGTVEYGTVKLKILIISAWIPICRAWETFLIVLVVYTAWVSPFEFGFIQKPKAPLSVTDNVVNGFFAIDIILTFFVAYLDKASYLLVDDRKKIAWKYASSWLAFDVISTIPSELAQKISPKALRSYGLFNMLRLWRLRRVSALFARWVDEWKRLADIHRYQILVSFWWIIFLIFTFYETDWRRIETSTIFGFDAPSLFVYVFTGTLSTLLCVMNIFFFFFFFGFVNHAFFLCHCRSLFLQFIVRDVSITYLQLATLILRKHGLVHLWVISFMRAYGSVTWLQCIGPSLL